MTAWQHIAFATLLGATSASAQVQPAPVAADSTTALAAADSMNLGRIAGHNDARKVRTGQWIAAGFAAGVVGGVLGTGVVSLVARRQPVTVPANRQLQIVGTSAAYQEGYRAGYSRKLRSKRGAAAFRGALVPTLAWVAIAVTFSGL